MVVISLVICTAINLILSVRLFFLNQTTLALCLTLQKLSMFSNSGLKIQSLSKILEDSSNTLTAKKKKLYFYLALK